MASEDHLYRVRRICLALPGATEKISHGEPTFFVHKKVFAMFASHHHHNGHIAVWLAAEPGVQEMLVATAPGTFFRPPYVGVRGWIGIELGQIADDELASYIQDAWRSIAPKSAARDAAVRETGSRWPQRTKARKPGAG